MTDTDELIDFSILPASRVQNYEQKIEEQYSKIENLNKKVTDLESILEKSKTDAESKSELENLSNAEESISSEPSVKEVSGSIEKTEADKVSPPSVVKETVEPSNCKIIKGKNLNKECRTCQLREKLNDSDFSIARKYWCDSGSCPWIVQESAPQQGNVLQGNYVQQPGGPHQK